MMNQKTPLKKVAVIGCGKSVEGQEGWAIGHAHGGALTELSDQVELVGVDLSPENLAAFGDRFNLPETNLFASTDELYAAFTPDVVAICTWPKLHAPMAMDAMDKGVKGVVLEKPIALDAGEISQLVQKATATGCAISIAHQRVYDPYFQTMKKIARSGALGSPLTVQAHVGDNWDVLSWTTHWFAMANYMFDSAPSYVLAGMDITDKRIYQQAVENASIVFAEYPDHQSATFLTGPLSGGDFRISGPEGMLVKEGEELLAITAKGVKRHPIPAGGGGFKQLYEDLFQEMAGGSESLCSIHTCAAATEMAYAAQESARTARKVPLPLQVQFPPVEVMQHPALSPLNGKKVLLYADAHFGSGGREGLAETIEHLTQQPPTILDAEKCGLRQMDVEGQDLIVLYHTQADADEETQSVLKNWVASGKALSIVHAGLGAWPEWEEYHSWCGLIWEWGVSTHPYSPVTLKTATSTGVNFPYAEGWLPKDEVFIQLKQTTKLVIDATAEIVDTGERYPAAWHSESFPQVGCWMPGHLRSSWKVPAMRQGLEAVLTRIITLP